MNRRYFLGAALAVASAPAFARHSASADVRTLSLHHLHTDERLSVAYRIGDNYQRSALQRLNHFLRDFRTGDETAIDPQLFDLLYDVKRRLGHDDGTFEIISGYRSPRTNNRLRRTSSGVARRSLHMTGQAIDVRLTEMPTRNIRDAALTLSRGGVGYYPRSDFVHLDTGRVRRWGA
ncbi:DUF882 domain-containing protein [uncultured Thiohalocapsa sp.]|uniref:YcbK family protein n=1 Tax=uncultured Thiohalocapsa sp. TaxID=768990 RepID=UPI0025CF33EA|nr:DUF882 domain-containing protein [uncultured Thiohalocapsa sp.]